MLSAVVTALLLIVMLLIIAGLVISAQREYRRQKRLRTAETWSLTTAPHTNATVALWLREGGVVYRQRSDVTAPSSSSLPASWYARRRTFVSLGLLLMVLLALLIQQGLADERLHQLGEGINFYFLGYSQAHEAHEAHEAHDLQLAAHARSAAAQAQTTASMRVVRVDSTSSSQYYNAEQLNVWSYSSCSGIAMEMVMNAYGRKLIAADVLQVEQQLGVWDSSLGLLHNEGIAMTASYFGFNADISNSLTLQDLINISNAGKPIIVNLRDSYYYPYGHFFVVRGGDDQYVYIADSSPADFRRMTHSMFLGMWQNYSAILTPRQGS